MTTQQTVVAVTTEEAEMLVSNLLRREALRIVTELGWGEEMKQRQVYVASDLQPRLDAAKAHRERVDAFRLSPLPQIKTWAPILEAELVAETVMQVMNFALSQVTTPVPVAIPQSYIPQWQQWYPGNIGQLVSSTKGFNTSPPLAKALLFQSLGLTEAAQAQLRGVLETWLVTGFVILADGAIQTTRHHPPTRTHERLLPLSKQQQDVVCEKLLPGLFMDDEDELKRAHTLLTLAQHVQLDESKFDIAWTVEQAIAGYSRGKWLHRDLYALIQMHYRAKLIGAQDALNYEAIAKVATVNLIDLLKDDDHEAERIQFASLLRQICDLAQLKDNQRIQLIRDLFATVEADAGLRARRVLFLEDELHLIETLLDGEARIQQIRIFVEKWLAQSLLLGKLQELACIYSFTDLLPQIKAEIREAEARELVRQKGLAELDRQRDEEVAAAQQRASEALKTAVQLLEVEPDAGKFLIEEYPQGALT